MNIHELLKKLNWTPAVGNPNALKPRLTPSGLPARPGGCNCRRKRQHEMTAAEVLGVQRGPPWRLDVHVRYCPGDSFAGLQALQNLHLMYPGEYLTSIHLRGGAELLHNCPWNSPKSPGVLKVDLRHGTYENALSRVPMTMSEAYTKELEKAIGRPITRRTPCPPVWWSAEEEAWRPPVKDYCLVNFGFKPHDFPSKFCGSRIGQDVVDWIIAQGLTPVQIGAGPPHVHKPLVGVHNLIGQTSVRQLLCWARHAKFNVGPMSFLLWVSMAVHTPYVGYVGGREHTCWTWGPGVHHVTEYTCGGPCGASLVVPVPDGAPGNGWNSRACTKPVLYEGETIPQCMRDMGSAKIIETCARVWRGQRYIPLEVV